MNATYTLFRRMNSCMKAMFVSSKADQSAERSSKLSTLLFGRGCKDPKFATYPIPCVEARIRMRVDRHIYRSASPCRAKVRSGLEDRYRTAAACCEPILGQEALPCHISQIHHDSERHCLSECDSSPVHSRLTSYKGGLTLCVCDCHLTPCSPDP